MGGFVKCLFVFRMCVCSFVSLWVCGCYFFFFFNKRNAPLIFFLLPGGHGAPLDPDFAAAHASLAQVLGVGGEVRLLLAIHKPIEGG